MWTLTFHSKHKTSLCAGLLALYALYVSCLLVQAQETFTGQWLLEFNPEVSPIFL
jgi:hypothetical protein